eukprot:442297-Hanusia_phi.AAC.2
MPPVGSRGGEQVRASRLHVRHASVVREGQVGKVLLEQVDPSRSQRRDLSVLLRAQPLQHAVARMHYQVSHASLAHRPHEPVEGLIPAHLVRPQPALHADRHPPRSPRDLLADPQNQLGVVHESRPEASHALSRHLQAEPSRHRAGEERPEQAALTRELGHPQLRLMAEKQRSSPALLSIATALARPCGQEPPSWRTTGASSS